MKLFIDDLRQPPSDLWTVARTFEEASKLITSQAPRLTAIAFDHDLSHVKEQCNGYALFCLVEQLAEADVFVYPLDLTCHSANPSGRGKIRQGIAALYARHPNLKP